jgi:hypothetical protein
MDDGETQILDRKELDQLDMDNYLLLQRLEKENMDRDHSVLTPEEVQFLKL